MILGAASDPAWRKALRRPHVPRRRVGVNARRAVMRSSPEGDARRSGAMFGTVSMTLPCRFRAWDGWPLLSVLDAPITQFCGLPANRSDGQP